jgi:hypothetical protein
MQIGQVFSTYLTDYFTKEALHVRNQLSEMLRSAVDDPNALSRAATSGAVQLPMMRADRIKSVPWIVQTVGNKVFVNRIVAIVTDAVCRMESIGRDDKKLTHRLKDMFLLEIGYLHEGLFLPWSRATVTSLLRLVSARTNANTGPPLPETLAVLAVITYGVGRMKSHFDEVFARPLAVVPNIVAVCKENRLKVFKELDLMARQMLYAWTICAVAQVSGVSRSFRALYPGCWPAVGCFVILWAPVIRPPRCLLLVGLRVLWLRERVHSIVFPSPRYLSLVTATHCRSSAC